MPEWQAITLSFLIGLIVGLYTMNFIAFNRDVKAFDNSFKRLRETAEKAYEEGKNEEKHGRID